MHLNISHHKNHQPFFLPSSSSSVTCMARQRYNCCTYCLSTLTSLGLTAFFLWLTFRADQPKCFIQSLSIPSLSATSHHKNDTLIFQLTLQNDNLDKGIHYDTLLLTFSVFTNNASTRPLANASLTAFYQGRGKTARKWGSAAIASNGGRANRFAARNGKVFVRVEVATKVKYRVWMAFYTKPERLVGGANVEVNASTGEKVNPKGIRLGDIPPRLGSDAVQVRSCSVAFVGVFVSGLFLTVLT